MNAQRIPSIELSAADETTKRNFEKLTARIGRVPNMPRAMAQSPAALQGWMSLLEALAKGLLTKKLGASRRKGAARRQNRRSATGAITSSPHGDLWPVNQLERHQQLEITFA